MDATDLRLTNATESLLKAGKRKAAIAQHNATVKRAFERAAEGEIINLSDLMASAETLHADG